MDELTKHYLVAALWTATDEDGNPLDSKHIVEDFSTEAIARAENDVKKFKKSVENSIHLRVNDSNSKELLEEWFNLDDQQTGHDLSLTRNHQGCGFWEYDHTSKELGDILTDCAHKLGEISVWESNGKLEFE
jgi:hypothetical protein